MPQGCRCNDGSAAEAAQKGEESVEERGDEAEYSVHFHSFFWWAEARLGIASGGRESTLTHWYTKVQE